MGLFMMSENHLQTLGYISLEYIDFKIIQKLSFS